MKRLVPVLGLAAALLAAVEVRAANTPGALDLPPSNVVPAPVDVAPTAPRARSGRPIRPAIRCGQFPFLRSPRRASVRSSCPRAARPRRPLPARLWWWHPRLLRPPPSRSSRRLSSSGAIAGDSEGFAVFLDQATNNVVRLKTGQDHQGWMLRSVKGREATLEKNKRSTTLALPALNADIAAAAPPPPPSMLPRPGGGGMIPRMPGPAGPQPPGAAPGGARPAARRSEAGYSGRSPAARGSALNR